MSVLEQRALAVICQLVEERRARGGIVSEPITLESRPPAAHVDGGLIAAQHRIAMLEIERDELLRRVSAVRDALAKAGIPPHAITADPRTFRDTALRALDEIRDAVNPALEHSSDRGVSRDLS